MDTAQPPSRTQLFTVRVWREDPGARRAAWRGEVHHVVGGEIRYLRDWPALVASMQAMQPQPGGAGAPERTIKKHATEFTPWTTEEEVQPNSPRVSAAGTRRGWLVACPWLTAGEHTVCPLSKGHECAHQERSRACTPA
jgi:hypothetical protein